MKLLNFQKTVINAAIKTLENNKIFVFQSPTGTGKTFIIANLIERYMEHNSFYHPNDEFTYLFIAPSTGDLYSQSYEKFYHWMNNKIIKNFNIVNNKLKDKKLLLMPYRDFSSNTVYFFGWSSIIKAGNRITNEDSEFNTFWKTLERTKYLGRKIVLIIDEAHLNNTKLGNDFIKRIDADKIIKMSATIKGNEKIDFTVTYNMAIEEKIVKRNFSINYDLNDPNGNWKEYIKSAIKTQEKVKKEYRKNKINLNPLIIIQIPDSSSNTMVDYEMIYSYLNQILNIHEHKIAVYLDKIKTHSKEEITNNQSEVEILIFKQAIATGWDVPRANMYVRLRSIKEESFKIQSIGRVLRNPLLKYYNNEFIDNCFIYTESDELIANLMTNFSGQINRINFKAKPDKKELFSNKINILNLNYKENNIEINTNEIVDSLLGDVSLIEELVEKVKENNLHNYDYVVSLNESIESLDKSILTEKWVKSRQLQFSQNKLTLFEIKNMALYKYKNNYYYELITNFCRKLSENNYVTVKEFLYLLIKNNEFRRKLEYKINSYIIKNIHLSTELFVLPDFMKYDLDSSGIGIDESLSPYINLSLFSLGERKKDFDSNLEQDFYNFLVDVKDKYNIELIFRNYTDENSYYINYIASDGKIRKFYPDFIIKIKNKYIICDTKGGKYDEEVESKKDAIDRYLQNVQVSGIEIFFGMVYQKNSSGTKFEFINNSLTCNFELLFTK